MYMIFKKRFSDIFFSFLIIIFIIVVCIVSYYRFVIKQDYVVGYEGECDITVNNCFIGCDDDSCTKEYFYSKVQKYAPDLYNECGKDITDCANANVCLVKDKNCTVTYCDPEIDGDTCQKIVINENIIQKIEQTSTTSNSLLLVK